MSDPRTQLGHPALPAGVTCYARKSATESCCSLLIIRKFHDFSTCSYCIPWSWFHHQYHLLHFLVIVQFDSSYCSGKFWWTRTSLKTGRTSTSNGRGPATQEPSSKFFLFIWWRFDFDSYSQTILIVKPESKSPIPCPNRPQILTPRSDQV